MLRTVIRSLFSVSALLLLLVFIIRVFAPGNPETAAFFKLVQTVQPLLDPVINLLILPITMIFNLVGSFLPVGAKAWFPITPAAPAIGHVATWLLQMPGLAGTPIANTLGSVDYNMLFPGVFDWRLPLAIGLWGVVESILLNFVEHFANIRRQRLRGERDEALRRTYEAPAPPSPSASTSLRQAAHQTDKESVKDLLFRKVVREIKQDEFGQSQSVVVDPLTQLPSRKAFLERVAVEIDNARMRGTFLAVILADFDDFKQLNQVFGTAAGDAVLTQAGLIFSQISPPQGKAVPSRYGDEELALLLTDTSPEAAAYVAEFIREQIGLIRFVEVPQLSIAASVGLYSVRFVSTNGSLELTNTGLIGKADAQMFKAKRAGKNRVSADCLP